MEIKDIKRSSTAQKKPRKVRVVPPPRTIVLKEIKHKYGLKENGYTTPVNFKLSEVDVDKYKSVMLERESLTNDRTLKEINIDHLKEQHKYSAFSIVAEIARYLNVSCLLIDRILRESVDGIDAIVELVNRYNEILDDVVIPVIFHTLYEVTIELVSEDKELVLLREPKDAGYYVFTASDDMVITKDYPGFTSEEVAKSFHADTYCFDSKPEKECFMQYIKSPDIEEIYFTGMFTSHQGDLAIQYYDADSGRVRHYYPDFFAKFKNGLYQLIEVKGDNKIDDELVKAKAAAATEMAVASGVEYKIFAGSEVINTKII